jgi:hypothetical protein
MASKKGECLTFNSEFGSTVSIPEEQLSVYVVTKADQSAALNRIIANQVGGFTIEIDDNDMFALTGLAEEVAHALSKTTMTAIETAAKGGV